MKSPFKRSVADSGVSVHQKSLPVRIPSQFNDRSLYGDKSDRPDAGGARKYRVKGRLVANYHRQVIRMILALVLVMVVINAASQPEFYEPFFQAGAVDPGSVSSTSVSSTSVNSTESLMVIPEDIRQRSVEVAASFSDQQQVSVARSLMRFQNGERDPSLMAEMDQIPVKRVDLEIDALIDSLIAETEKRVIDGAVWRSSDRDALRLRLIRVGQTSVHRKPRPAAVVGVLSLLQQPEAFRGQPVRIIGRIARVDSIREGSGKNDPLPDYWQLWLQPSSGADRPVVVLVTSIPDEIASFNEGGPASDAPKVVVQGTFFKRLAYQSSVGADLAPVVVGRIWQPTSRADSSTRQLGTGSGGGDVNLIGPIAIVAAAIGLGIVLAGLVVWRTSASAKRTRRIRRDSEAAAFEVPSGFDAILASPKHESSET